MLKYNIDFHSFILDSVVNSWFRRTTWIGGSVEVEWKWKRSLKLEEVINGRRQLQTFYPGNKKSTRSGREGPYVRTVLCLHSVARGWRENWRETGLSHPGEIIYKPSRLAVLDVVWKLKRKESHEVKVKGPRKAVKKEVQRRTEMLATT
jgi:hypothetical protein